MKESEAAATIAMVAALWPSPALPSDAIAMWSRYFESRAHELEDIRAGLETLAASRKMRPALAEIETATIDARRARMGRLLAIEGDVEHPTMTDLFPHVVREGGDA